MGSGNRVLLHDERRDMVIQFVNTNIGIRYAEAVVKRAESEGFKRWGKTNGKKKKDFFEVQPTPGGDPEHMQRCEQPVTIKRMINSQVLDQRVLLLSPVSHHHTHIEKHHTKQMSVTPQLDGD